MPGQEKAAHEKGSAGYRIKAAEPSNLDRKNTPDTISGARL